MHRSPISSICLFLLIAAAAAAQPLPILEQGLLPGDAAVSAATGSQQDHDAARGGDLTLVVWSDFRGQEVGGGSEQSGGDVFGIRLDAQGAPLDASPILIAGGMGLQDRPFLAWNGEAWLVVFRSQDPVGGYFEYRTRAVRVSAQGQVLDATPITFPATQFEPNDIGLNVAGQGGQWLVTRCIYHNDGYGTFLAGQRIDTAGQLLDPTPIVIMDWVYGPTKAVVADGEYLVIGPDWSDGGTLKAQRVGLDAQPFGASFTVPGMTIAGSGSEYYVSWIVDFGTLLGSRMTLDGTLLTPAGTVLVSGFTQYDHSTLAHDGTQWWLEWGISDILRTVRIDAAGNVLDPNGGVLLPIVIGGNVNTAYGPLMTGRVGGGVHLFWYDLRVALGYDTNVFKLPISAGNVPGAESSVSTGTRSQRTPDFAQGPGGQTALVFVSEAAHDDRVLLHFLDADGQPLSAEPIEVAAAASIGQTGVAWNGALYLVTWDDGTLGVRARRLLADGSFVDPAPFNVMPGFDPDVEALGEDFLIATARYATYPQYIDTWMRIVDGPTGGFQNAATPIGGGYVNVGPRVRQDGSRWIVTYHSHWSHDSSNSDAVYNFVSPNGTFTAAANPATTSGAAGTPDVAFSGQKYLFVWRNNSLSNANNYIAGRLMNADGTFSGGNFTIAEAPGRQLRPVVGWDGATFVVAWDDQRHQDSFFDARTDVYGARVSEAGVVLDPAGFPIQVGAQGDATAAILSRTDGVSLVACARFTTTMPYDSYRIGVSKLGTSTLATGVGPLARPFLRGNAPNPFNPRTAFSFTLDHDAQVSLAVFDLRGHRVRTIVEQRLAAGNYDGVYVWDGNDEQGRAATSGTYLYRLTTEGGYSESRRMTLLK